ncbi:BA14K family protein [Bartonella sp. B41]
MTKLAKLAVLSAVSTATILTPLTTALANSTVVYDEQTTRSIRTSPSGSSSIDSRYYPYADRRTRTQNSYHIEQKTHRYTEHKTHRHVHQHVGVPRNTGDTLAAGVLGLAAGAILGNALKQPEQPQVVYQIQPQNQIVYQAQQTPTQQPGTDEWLRYCKKTYRSFNPQTGTFRGHDGLDHFCYAPIK